MEGKKYLVFTENGIEQWSPSTNDQAEAKLGLIKSIKMAKQAIDECIFGKEKLLRINGVSNALFYYQGIKPGKARAKIKLCLEEASIARATALVSSIPVSVVLASTLDAYTATPPGTEIALTWGVINLNNFWELFKITMISRTYRRGEFFSRLYGIEDDAFLQKLDKSEIVQPIPEDPRSFKERLADLKTQVDQQVIKKNSKWILALSEKTGYTPEQIIQFTHSIPAF